MSARSTERMTGRGVVPAASLVIQVRPRLLGCIEERERAAPGRGSAPLLAAGAAGLAGGVP